MNIYNRNKDLIEKLLKIAIKENEFVDYVLMMPNYCVETRDLNGFVKPNRYFTIEAIYDFYKENPDSKIDNMLYDALIFIAKNYKGERAIITILETIEYQLDSEKKKTAPFKLDCQSILNELRVELIKNKSFYMEPKEVFDNKPFWNNVQEFDSQLSNNYGVKIL